VINVEDTTAYDKNGRWSVVLMTHSIPQLCIAYLITWVLGLSTCINKFESLR
jgi:hypothetical protein